MTISSQSIVMCYTKIDVQKFLRSQNTEQQRGITTTCNILAIQVGGPPPGFPQKEHFLCGTSSEKASREGPNIQRTTARRFSRIGDGLSHRCHGGPRPTLELHPLQRGNRYMSRRYRVTHTNARAVTLADFQFALILPRNSHAAPPTEDEFHLLASYGRQFLRPAASLPSQHGINPSPNILPLNSTNGLRVRRRLAAE